MRLLCAAVCGVLIALQSPAAAEPVWLAGADGVLVHERSGAGFPETAANLRRLAPAVMTAKGDLAGVSYVGALSGTPWQVELLIARTLADPLDALLAETRQRMTRLPGANAGLVSDFVLQSKSGPVNGHRQRIAYRTRDGLVAVQEVAVVASGSWLGRLSTDYPETETERVEPRIGELIQQVHWPVD
jgi:hypothetical protein